METIALYGGKNVAPACMALQICLERQGDNSYNDNYFCTSTTLYLFLIEQTESRPVTENRCAVITMQYSCSCSVIIHGH